MLSVAHGAVQCKGVPAAAAVVMYAGWPYKTAGIHTCSSKMYASKNVWLLSGVLDPDRLAYNTIRRVKSDEHIYLTLYAI